VSLVLVAAQHMGKVQHCSGPSLYILAAHFLNEVMPVTASEQHSRRHGTLMAQQRCLLCGLGGQQLLLPEAAL
jgi:hypothetical protein